MIFSEAFQSLCIRSRRKNIPSGFGKARKGIERKGKREAGKVGSPGGGGLLQKGHELGQVRRRMAHISAEERKRKDPPFSRKEEVSSTLRFGQPKRVASKKKRSAFRRRERKKKAISLLWGEKKKGSRGHVGGAKEGKKGWELSKRLPGEGKISAAKKGHRLHRSREGERKATWSPSYFQGKHFFYGGGKTPGPKSRKGMGRGGLACRFPGGGAIYCGFCGENDCRPTGA